MIPVDTKKNKIKDLMNFIENDPSCFGGCITVPFKESVYKHLIKKISRKNYRKNWSNYLFI